MLMQLQPGPFHLCGTSFCDFHKLSASAVLTLSIKVMLGVHLQILCPQKFLGLGPKLHTKDLVMLTANIISDSCS